MEKPKLSFQDLIKKIHEKGISNGNFSNDDILSYLKERSYYYKISSYRKSYPKRPDGLYSDLTFEHLTITANLDLSLREYLLNLCLDIEHATRTKLMSLITEDDTEDGYSIIKEFKDTYPPIFEKVMNHFKNNKHKRDMFNKRTEISIWVFLEIIDYGTLVRLLEFYFHRKPDSRSKLLPNQHKFVKNIRNTCAHNNVFIINLFDPHYRIPRPDATTKSFANSMKINFGLLPYQKIIDLTNLFYLHKKICSPQLNKRRVEEGKKILSLYNDKKELFSLSNQISKLFDSILNKGVDFLKE